MKIAQLQIIIFSSGLESVTQSSNCETKYLLVMAESSTASTDASDSRKAQTKKRDATKA